MDQFNEEQEFVEEEEVGYHEEGFAEEQYYENEYSQEPEELEFEDRLEQDDNQENPQYENQERQAYVRGEVGNKFITPVVRQMVESLSSKLLCNQMPESSVSNQDIPTIYCPRPIQEN